MNLIRLIKLKQLNGDLDNLSKVESDILINFNGAYVSSSYFLKGGVKQYYTLYKNKYGQMFFKLFDDGNFVFSAFFIEEISLNNFMSVEQVKCILLDLFNHKIGIKDKITDISR